MQKVDGTDGDIPSPNHALMSKHYTGGMATANACGRPRIGVFVSQDAVTFSHNATLGLSFAFPTLCPYVHSLNSPL